MNEYGYAYLTSYGWTGSGTGLRKGAIDRPLAIPPKKNLSGLGKDRDDAFPFWDHLFAAASKTIKIKVSDEDDDVDDAETPGSVPLTRTKTGIISNRRPILGTPASASGITTPNPDADADAPRLSLVAIAKREAAKRGLYSRFFRGPALAPDGGDPRADAAHSSPASSASLSTPVPEHVGDTGTSRKRKLEDRVETKEERRERKRLKKERKAARAAKKAEKALAKKKTKEKMDRLDRKARKQRDKKAWSEQHENSLKARKQARKPITEPGDIDEPP